MNWSRIFYPTPAPPGFGQGKVLPGDRASWLSRMSIWWLGPFLDTGFSRPLEKEDFWELPSSRLTGNLTDIVEHGYYSRCPSEKRPYFMRDSNTATTDKDDESQNPMQNYDESLFKALHNTFKRRIWLAGILLVISDTLRTTTPLLNKVMITWLSESYIYSKLTDAERALASAAGFSKPQGIGYGVGLAFALFVMQESASIMANHFALAGMTTGLYVRTSIIGNIFRKSLRLSGRSRSEHSVGQITTMISTDATRLDAVSAFAHHLYSSPIQLIIGIGLLIGNLGYSALVGLAVLVFSIPIQTVLIYIMFNQRKKGVKITDKRVRLTTEVLQGIRLIKAYAWEDFYTRRIFNLRVQEVERIRKSSFALSWLVAMFSFIPELAAVLSFITYALTNHDLNIALIFSSLQLFNIIRIPLILIPFVLSSVTDAMVSFARLSKFLTAEELAEPYHVDTFQESALKVDGDFEWETVVKLEENAEKSQADSDKKVLEELKKEKEEKKKQKKALKEQQKASRSSSSLRWWKGAKAGTSEKNGVLPLTNDQIDEKLDTNQEEQEKPFSLKGLQLDVKKGSFIAIVGRIGSGKSSVLQALIGEMRRTRGDVVFGGSVAYVPQSSWIKNATVRDNILFGQEYDEDRFLDVIKTCSLEHDLTILPHGDNTEIGEKGINLSGGQKARVSLARAAYSKSDIVLLDDPLSAVDAYVGKSILENCLLDGPLAKRTRILVTHALHVLDRTDYIYVMDNGKIIEEGSYSELMARNDVFCHLIEEYGNSESQNRNRTKKDEANIPDGEDNTKDELDAALMQAEERNTGAVTWDIYAKYLQHAGGVIWAPVVLFLLVMGQANNVATTLFLGFWTGNTIPNFSQGKYMAVYAALGAFAAISGFATTYTFVIVSLKASLSLYKGALGGVLRSRIAFFDTTPMGRIVSRLSKDQDTIDTGLPLILMQFLTSIASVFGTVGLVFYTFPYLGIIFLPLAVLYYAASIYYRRSSVETKRLDSLLRSFLYGSYSETLTGLSTIRAFNQQSRSITDAQSGLDMENRAYLMTVIMQRWLALRLDFFANILVLGIALFGAGFRTSVNPAKISVVLTYTLSATQMFSETISLFAQSEQNMNAVERVLHYVELPPEIGDSKSPPVDPPPPWPKKGAISFRNVSLSYREGLPLVLKDVSFNVNAGEKIGIVGRTGSGKSSLIQALLRVVEVQEGRIDIDDFDISNLTLHTLRTQVAFVPQDTTLFLGTLRDNLDPQNIRTDAELISILQRAWLLPKSNTADPLVEAKYRLDAIVGDEGSNYSLGEKQLLALSRALVKNSRIIILDEATSNVDVETDSKVQQTIQTEFMSSTLLCIAHRLNTIAHYDRIIVMEDGKVAEFDTVLNLFDRTDSVFRNLCDEAHLQRSDILKMRQEHLGTSAV